MCQMCQHVTENLRVLIQEAVTAAIEALDQQDRIWTKGNIHERTGLNPRTILNQEALGLFPERLQLTHAKVGWSELEIRAWQAELPRGVLPAPKVRMQKEN